MSRYSNLNEKQIRLLSAHLDGELNEKERAQVSMLLAASPDVAQTLAGLRLVKAVLLLLPVREVPHNYTLTRLEAQAAKPSWVINALRITSGLSAAALAVVLALDFLMPFQGVPQAVMLERFTDEAMSVMESEEPVEKGKAPIINWTPSIPYGIGGEGGDGAAEPEGSGGLIIPDITLKPGEEMPETSASADQIDEGAEMETPSITAEVEGHVAEEKHAPNTGPILGIQSPELQGEMIGDEAVFPQMQALQSESARIGVTRLIEITLLVVTLLTALAALILRRRKRVS